MITGPVPVRFANPRNLWHRQASHHLGARPLIYVSGDNASLRLVSEVARRFHRIDVAVLFAGAARTPLVDGYLTLTSPEAAEAADILGRPWVLPVHTDGWAHFTQNGVSLRKAFNEAGLGDLLLEVTPGKAVRA